MDTHWIGPATVFWNHQTDRSRSCKFSSTQDTFIINRFIPSNFDLCRAVDLWMTLPVQNPGQGFVYKYSRLPTALIHHAQLSRCLDRHTTSGIVFGDAVSTFSLLDKPGSLTNAFVFSSLHGVGMLQCWLYFCWYPRDGWRTKSTVCTFLITNICIAFWPAPTGPSSPVRNMLHKKWHPNSYIYQIRGNFPNSSTLLRHV